MYVLVILLARFPKEYFLPGLTIYYYA